jgi:hypothetical protein
MFKRVLLHTLILAAVVFVPVLNWFDKYVKNAPVLTQTTAQP